MPSINPNAPHPDFTDIPDDAVRVSVEDGQEHGYIGASPDTHDRDDYTVAGVTRAGRNPGPTENVPESTSSKATATAKSSSRAAAKDTDK